MGIGGINEFFAIVAGPMGMGAAIDTAIGHKNRELLAMYIFGFRNQSFPVFERDLIRSLMSPFISDGKLNTGAIFNYSVIVTFFAGLILFSTFDLIPDVDEFRYPRFVFILLAAAMMSILVSIGSLPFDMLSMRITKLLFLDRSPKFPFTIIWICVDFLLSTAAFYGAALLVVFIWKKFPQEGTEPITMLVVFLYASALTAGLVSVLQFLIVVASFVLRATLIVTRLNNILAMNSNAHNFPLTFLGLAMGLILYALT